MARADQAERDTGVVGTLAGGTGGTFRQSPDAQGGPTGIILDGKIIPNGTRLTPEQRERQQAVAVGKNGRTVPSSRPEDLWPEMFASKPRDLDAEAEELDSEPDPGDGYTAEDLEPLTVAQLEELAEAKGVTVERAEGDGDPLKADYIRSLIGK